MNGVIQQAREHALALLKPSQKEIEHGLELHAHALVCDAYGFAPRVAIDGDAAKALVTAGATEFELQDCLEEMSTRPALDAKDREETRQAWEAAGVACILQNAGEEGQSVPQVLKRLARFTFATDLSRDLVQRAVSPDDIFAAKKNNRHCLYLSSNGIPLAERWLSRETELEFIRIFFQLGIRMMHLTYNRRNLIGDGCMETANAGLSDFGRAVVAEMNRVGVIVDTAHCGWQTGLEAAQVSSKPVVASHAGCSSLHPHRRCKSDEILKAISDSGGYLGVCCVPAFLGRSEDLCAMLDHIDYAAKTIGTDHVAIGTDIAYTPDRMKTEWEKIPPRPKSRPRWEHFWLPNDPLFDPKYDHWQDRSLSWTNWPLFTVALVQRGYSDGDIEKIIGGNVLRVARAVWPSDLPSTGAADGKQ